MQIISSKPEWVTVRPVITKPEYADIGINIIYANLDKRRQT